MISALHSPYIIDGIQQELTPARILDGCCRSAVTAAPPVGLEPVVDESCEAGLDAINLDKDPRTCLEKMTGLKRSVPLAFASNYTRGLVASALIDALWHRGHFKIGDLALKAVWGLDPSKVGNMAAFYRSVEAAGEYLDSLGLGLESYSLDESGECALGFEACLADYGGPENIFVDQPYRSEKPVLEAGTAPCTLDSDPQSWIVYIPFDTAEYRLGGSLFAQATGQTGGVAPGIGDADYFLDCYEVVRELVEDGVAISGATVLEGGLYKALYGMLGGKCGASVDVSDMMKAFNEPNLTRILFAEVPGALIQVRDMDFDYLDAELLLQDVAYFPLGHPVPASDGIELRASSKTGLQDILESLLRNQGGEGED